MVVAPHKRCLLNGCVQELELDTGSSISIVTEGMMRYIRSAKVYRTYLKANDYGNNSIKFVGETTRNVKIKNAIEQHTFLLVNNNLSPLFGKDLCKKYLYLFKSARISSLY